MLRDYSDLNVWKKGYDLLMEIYSLSSNFPAEEKFGLTRQIRNSANSIIANIAEAHGRFYHADKQRVLYHSRGEIDETRSHLMVARGLKYIDTNTLEKLDKEYEGLKIGLNAFIRSFEEKKNV